MTYHLQKKQTGFSLVETLVAISILLIIIAGPMAISSHTAKSSTFASEQVQAFFLAQEGVELAQKAKDDFLLEFFDDPISNPDPWGWFVDESGFFADCFKTDGCGLYWSESSYGALDVPLDCASGNDCLLYKNDDPDDRSQFTHDIIPGGETPFTRQVIFSKEGDDGLHVRSIVTWRTGSLVANQKVEVDTYLYNIYDI